MEPVAATVAEDLWVVAASFFEGVAENSEVSRVEVTRGQVAVVVDDLGHLRDSTVVPGQPSGIDGDPVDRIAENATDELRLLE